MRWSGGRSGRWHRAICDAAIGSDFQDIKRYKEFEVSPQNEWVELDINLHLPRHEEGWGWNAGFEHFSRVDKPSPTWYLAMRNPFPALGTPAACESNSFRVNFFRPEDPPDATKEVMWRPTMNRTFHVPERSGVFKIVAH